LTDDQKTLSQILEHLAALNEWTQRQDDLHLKDQLDELTSLTRSLKTNSEALAKALVLAEKNERIRAQEHITALNAFNSSIHNNDTATKNDRLERHKLQDRLEISVKLNEKLSARSPLAATIQDNLKAIVAGSLICFLVLLSLFVLMFLYIPKMNSGYTTMTTESFLTLDTEASHGRTWLHYLRNLPKEQADPLFSMVRSNHPPSSHALCLTTTPPSNSDENSSNSSSKSSDNNASSSKKSAKRKP
jgi:hypothetical protein